MTKSKVKITAREITTVAMMVAVIEVCKLVMMHIPNVELTSFWLIMFTLFFKKRVLFVVPVFILLEGCIFGFGTWWIMYLYVWPILVLATWIVRKSDSKWTYAILSGAFGLSYGFLCSFAHGIIMGIDGGLRGIVVSAFSWWIAGIPWDLIHGVANFIIMMLLYTPIRKVMNSVQSYVIEDRT